MPWHTKKNTKTAAVSDQSKRMLWRQLIVGVVLTALVAALVWGIWHLTRLPALTIDTVTAEGGLTITPAQLAVTAEELLEGEYYRLVPRRFTYLYPKEEILETLSAIPRVKEVILARRSATELHIVFTEYEPVALWCTTEPNSCVFVDAAGYAFAPAPMLTGGAFIRYVDTSREPVVGEVGIDTVVLESTQRFAAAAEEIINVRVQAVLFDDRDISYQLGGGGLIYTNRGDEVATVLANVETILSSEQFAHLEPGNFEYIDLRYGNKVFVQEVVDEVGTTTEEIIE